MAVPIAGNYVERDDEDAKEDAKDAWLQSDEGATAATAQCSLERKGVPRGAKRGEAVWLQSDEDASERQAVGQPLRVLPVAAGMVGVARGVGRRTCGCSRLKVGQGGCRFTAHACLLF